MVGNGGEGTKGFVEIKGRVTAELKGGELVGVEGVLIKTSQGMMTYTIKGGYFECPANSQEEFLAICAFKNGFQLWVDWNRFERGDEENEWDITLKAGPEDAVCELIQMPRAAVAAGPGCIVPQVLDGKTNLPIPNAKVKLDGQTWRATDSQGNNVTLCYEAGEQTLCARKLEPYPKKCKPVTLELGGTTTGEAAIICLDHV